MEQDMSSTAELDDIQGIIVRGYGSLKGAYFVLLRIRDATATKRWLGDSPCAVACPGRASRTLASTSPSPTPGWKVGPGSKSLDMFSGEFREGMTGTEHRQRILADLQDSTPERWRWGGPRTAGMDLLLMLYAAEDRLRGFIERTRTALRVPDSTSLSR